MLTAIVIEVVVLINKLGCISGTVTTCTAILYIDCDLHVDINELIKVRINSIVWVPSSMV